MPVLDSITKENVNARVQCSSDRDEHGAMTQVQLASIAVDSRVHDEAKPNAKTPWCDSIVKFTACIPARPDDPSQIYLERHRTLQKANARTKHWPENIARFAKNEMKAALDAIDQAEMRSYTIVYHYCSEAAARRMCESGCGLDAGLTVTTLLPTDLNWQKYAGGKFKDTAGEALWGAGWRDKHVGELQAVLVMGVPSSVVLDGMSISISKQMTIPESLLMLDDSSTGTALVYSNAFVRKSYTLESVPSSSVISTGELVPADADADADADDSVEDVDMDSNGEVSKEEALSFFRSKGYDVDSSWLDGAWDIMDKDQNGTLDVTEFLEMFDTVKTVKTRASRAFKVVGRALESEPERSKEALTEKDGRQLKQRGAQPEPEPEPQPRPQPEPRPLPPIHGLASAISVARSTTPPRKPTEQTRSQTPPRQTVANAAQTPPLDRNPPPLQPRRDRSGQGRTPKRQASSDGGAAAAASSGHTALAQTRAMAP